MGLFDKIRRKIAGDAAARRPRPEDVWEISDRTEFLIAMSERLCAKCGEGERLSALFRAHSKLLRFWTMQRYSNCSKSPEHS